jgi:hypothetical protein
MSANSSASSRGAAVLLAAALVVGLSAEPVRWYSSDAAGIAYLSVSAPTALRAPWALEVRTLNPGIGDAAYAGALGPDDRLEIKILYQDGVERRKTVSVLDPDGFLRFEESRTTDGFLRRERYDALHRITEETVQGIDGTGTEVVYEWAGDRILRAKGYALGSERGEPLWIDRYRYDRAGGLRTIERSPEAASFSQDSRLGTPRRLELREPDGSSTVTRFDELGRETETLSLGADGKTVVSVERMSYAVPGEAAPGEAAPGVPAATARRSTDGTGAPKDIYLDAKGRVIREVVYAPDGSTEEETTTEWSGDRVAATTTVAGGKIRRTEYGYDESGRRVLERNFADGALERSMIREGDMEIEELYRNGIPVLRSTYIGGILQSEERIRTGSGSVR